MSTHVLDTAALHRLVDAERVRRGLSWRAVSRECGVSWSTTRRLGQGLRPEADSLLTLLVWAGVEAAAVTVAGRPVPPCDACCGIPPTGFACLSCGAEAWA